MITVKLPDGTSLQFPDGTSRDVMKTATAKLYAKRQALPPAAAPQAPAMPTDTPEGRAQIALQLSGMDTGLPQGYGVAPALPAGLAKAGPQDPALVASIGRNAELARQTPVSAKMQGIASGSSFGFNDEIGAAMISPFTDETYAQVRDGLRGAESAAVEQYPGAYYTGQAAGGLAIPGLGTAKAIGAAPTLGRAIMTGATSGAFTGALTGAGMSEGGFGETMTDAGKSALMGAGLGGAIGGIGNKIVAALQSGAAKRALLKSAPSADELGASARSIFKKADDVSNLPRAGLTNAFAGIDDAFLRSGGDEILTPQAGRALSRIEDSATNPAPNMTFRELDILRRQAGVAAGDATNPTQAAIGVQFQNQLDDVLDGADAGLSDEVAAARDMWGKMRRSEVIEGALGRADNQASGLENGIRTQIRAMLNSKNPKALRGYSADEIAQMQKIVKGTAAGNIAKLIGKVGPGLGRQTNALGMMAGAGAGALSPIGPIGAVAVPAVGWAAQKISERGTVKNAEILAALVRSGGAMPTVKSGKASEAIVAALMKQVGQGSNGLQNLLMPQARKAQ